MFRTQSKTEAKARHISLLKQKINLLQVQGVLSNSSRSNVIMNRKLLNQIAQEESTENLQTKKLISMKKLNKVLQKQKQRFHKNSKQVKPQIRFQIKRNQKQNFWSTKQRYYIFKEKKSLPKQDIKQKQQYQINWQRIVNRSEIIATNMIKRRIKRFQDSTKIISSTVCRLRSEQDSLVNAILKQFSIEQYKEEEKEKEKEEKLQINNK